jgi:hypothetical protein
VKKVQFLIVLSAATLFLMGCGNKYGDRASKLVTPTIVVTNTRIQPPTVIPQAAQLTAIPIEANGCMASSSSDVPVGMDTDLGTQAFAVGEERHYINTQINSLKFHTDHKLIGYVTGNGDNDRAEAYVLIIQGDFYLEASRFGWSHIYDFRIARLPDNCPEIEVRRYYHDYLGDKRPDVTVLGN